MIEFIICAIILILFSYSVCWVAGEADKAKARVTCKCGARQTGPLILADGIDVERHSEALCEDCPNCRANSANERHNRIAAATGVGDSTRPVALRDREAVPCS